MDCRLGSLPFTRMAYPDEAAAWTCEAAAEEDRCHRGGDGGWSRRRGHWSARIILRAEAGRTPRPISRSRGRMVEPVVQGIWLAGPWCWWFPKALTDATFRVRTVEPNGR